MYAMIQADNSQTPDSRLIATAYHEAGHAVIALALGKAIERVTILPNQCYLGACQIQKGRIKPTKDWLEDEMLILLAGMVAEARFTGRLCTQGAAQDLRGVRRLAMMRAAGERQIERLERRMLDKTEYMVNDDIHWSAIEAIAAELLKKETISGRAARHFFEQAEM
jgi:Peptidase family M41